MKLPGLFMFLAFAAVAVAAESPPTGLPASLPRYAFKPRVADYYPAASRNLEEQGTTLLRLCYDDQGRPSQVTVGGSSGYPRLDEAAVRWGKAVRITPGRFRTQPQPACVKIPARFSLEQPVQLPDEDLLLPEVQVPPVLKDLPLPPPAPGRFLPL